MKSPTLIPLTLFVVVLLLSACSRYRSDPRFQETKTQPSQPAQAEGYLKNQVEHPLVSLNAADRSQIVEAAVDRKILRNADLTLEVTSPTEAERQVASISETHGGFVATSESKQRDNADPSSSRVLDIKLVARVPANQFDSAVGSIEKLASNVIQRNVAGQDVTEEFIDLDARIKTQKALELQFLEIMKQAGKVPDALEVQRQISDVRTEIEKLEGRKRFLENHATMSTITVNLQAPLPIAVNTSSFSRSVREAMSESIDVASAIVILLIRFVIVMIPIVVLIFLPAGVAARYLVRRAKRMRLAQALEATPTSD